MQSTVIDPRTNHYIAYWDLVTTLALVFTALVTPVEVAYLKAPAPSARWSDTLFLMNRTIDVIFITDMLLQLRIGYQLHTADGLRWVMHSSKIIRHYLASRWFALDLFSVLTSLFDVLGDESTEDLKALRAVRTLRLVKLVKLARGSRIWKRWEMRMSINYSYLTLTGVVTMIVISCHWVACIWGLQATFEPLNSWYFQKGYCVEWGSPSRSEAKQMLTNGSCPDGWNCLIGVCSGDTCTGGSACEYVPMRIYTYALYFSVMTVTSVGYGDIAASQFNVAEQIICVAIMLGTGMLWGYLIGIFCSMAALSPDVQQFRDELSQLNNFMNEHKVGNEQRFRLREYMHQTIHLRTSESKRRLLTKLSPSMQGEMSLLVNEATIGRVWYLRNLEVGLHIYLASKLMPAIFPPAEFCPGGFLYILERGLVLYAGRPKRQGACWGEDVLLNNADLECDFPAVAVSYTWVLATDARTLNAAVQSFPTSMAKLEWVRRRWSVRRCVVREAEVRTFGAEPRVHFRGRMYPIYAKHIARRMVAERNAHDAAVIETNQKRKSEPNTHASLTKQADSKVAQKIARAATAAAAAEYGMQLRTSQMMACRSGGHARCRSDHTPRPGALPMDKPDVASASAAVAASVAAELSEQIESSVQATVRALLPEIAAAVAAQVGTALPKRKKLRAGAGRALGPSADGTDDDAPRKPHKSRSVTRSRPGRGREAQHGATAESSADEDGVPPSAPPLAANSALAAPNVGCGSALAAMDKDAERPNHHHHNMVSVHVALAPGHECVMPSMGMGGGGMAGAGPPTSYSLSA